MFSGSGDASENPLPEDSPMGESSSNEKQKVGIVRELFYFLSGISFLILISLPFFTGWKSLVVSVILIFLVSSIYGWLIFFKDILRTLRVNSLKYVRLVSYSIAACTSLLAFTFAAWTTTMQVYYVAHWNTPIYITAKSLVSTVPFGWIIDVILDNYTLIIWLGALTLGVLSFFSLAYILQYLIVEKYSVIVRNSGMVSVVSFALSSALWVFVPLLPLYFANLSDVTLLFILILAGFYILGTLIIYFVSLLIFESPIAAFGVCVIGWIGMSAAEGIINSVFLGLSDIWIVYSLIILVLMGVGGWLIAKAVWIFELSVRKLSRYIFLLVVFLLILSVIPLASVALTGDDGYSTPSEMIFVVDDSLPHPNIYWIHAESMVDETVLEKYFGKDTVSLSYKLENRGFYTNHNAYVTGPARTNAALASLFAPSFYDEYGDEYYSEGSWLHLPSYRMETQIGNTLKNNNEFIHAFESAGYSTIAVSSVGSLSGLTTHVDTNYLYDFGFVQNEDTVINITPLEMVFIYDQVDELDFISYSCYPFKEVLVALSLPTKLIYSYYADGISSEAYQYLDNTEIDAIFPDSDFREINSYGNLVQVLSFVLDNQHYPQLVMFFPSLAHFYFDHDENGIFIENSMDIKGYYGEYIFSEKLLQYMVNEIVVHDPEAIIVIQGDHGLHCYAGEANAEVKYSVELGQDIELEEILNHVLSAVRIPEQYQTEDYPEALQNPRNIVRYLVNSYVGENYEYIPWEEA